MREVMQRSYMEILLEWSDEDLRPGVSMLPLTFSDFRCRVSRNPVFGKLGLQGLEACKALKCARIRGASQQPRASQRPRSPFATPSP